MYKFHNRRLPSVFDTFFTQGNKRHNYNTRSASNLFYTLPKVRTNSGLFNVPDSWRMWELFIPHSFLCVNTKSNPVLNRSGFVTNPDSFVTVLTQCISNASSLFGNIPCLCPWFDAHVLDVIVSICGVHLSLSSRITPDKAEIPLLLGFLLRIHVRIPALVDLS